MRIVLLSNLDESAARDKLQGYNQVVAYYLREELRKAGHECTLVQDRMLLGMPETDHVIAISSVALRLLAGRDIDTLLNERGIEGTDIVGSVRAKCKRLYWLTDGPSRSIIPWGAGKADGSYVGMGADPDVCYPAQDETPTLLVNAWNKTVDNAEWSDQMLQRQIAAAEFCMSRGVRVLGMNCLVKGCEPVGRRNGNDVKLGYVPWEQVCVAYRRGWVFLDGTPKCIELGRVEAACCGAALLVPEVINQDPNEGLHYLPQVYWTSRADVGEQAMRLIDQMTTSVFASASSRAREYFSWGKVASRIVRFIEAVGDKAARVVPAPKPAPTGPQAPWVAYPLMVPPSRLWYQAGAAGPRRLAESVHAIGAAQIVEGTLPSETVYAQSMTTQQSGCHGKPDEFAKLIQSMSARGYDGPGIIAGINRRGQIVIHDGWHRSAAALALGVEAIPVSVHFRDEDWIALRHAVKALNNGHKLYQPIDHPDFTYWPHWRKDTPRRIEVITSWLTSEDVQTVCDLGCHSGVLSLALARAGFSVHGIDQNEKAVKVATLSAPMADIGAGDGVVSFAVGREVDAPCDAVVCLSALNHALVRDAKAGAEMLFKIAEHTKLLVLDHPTKGDPVGGDTEWTDTEAMAAFLRQCGWIVKRTETEGLQRTLMLCEYNGPTT